MQYTRTPARTATRGWAAKLTGIGATTALMTGMLVAGAPGTAHAAAPTSPIRYECTGPMGLVKLGVEVDITNLPDAAPTELWMPQGISFDLTIDFPTSLFGGLFGGMFGGLTGLGGLGGLLGGFGGFSAGDDVPGQLDDFSLMFGAKRLRVDGVSDDVTNPTKNPTLDTDGSTDEFALPTPGDYPISLPEEFSFSPLSFFGISLFSIDCELVSKTAVVDEVEVEEQESETETEVVTPTPTEEPIVVTTVTRQLGKGASGKVVAKVGKKTVGSGTLRKGVTRMKLKGLSSGTNAVKVTYLGNKTTKSSSALVRVRKR
ncbi:hypothetical protein [Nocardioides sp. R-C-SC26]|uniref:hypothetical protein n=1 Tax=Nocardioides sp. R-C-SC26 TaxID=2870414 RepID=UPI001E5AB403|nr:hypothetical protein [Nocardioides sp. R-C-SC26]